MKNRIDRDVSSLLKLLNEVSGQHIIKYRNQYVIIDFCISSQYWLLGAKPTTKQQPYTQRQA